MAGLAATYIDSTTFTVAGDLTTTFVVGRRVKADCGVDGYKFGTIASSSHAGGTTTVILTETSDALTSNLATVWYGIVGGGATDQSIPVHSHDGSEGSGGEVTSIIKQIVRTNITATVNTSSTIPYGSTPTNTSGAAFGNTSITLDNASNVVNVRAIIPCDSDNDAGFPTAIIIRGTTVIAVATTAFKKDVAGSHIVFDFFDTPGSVGPHTYYIRVGVQSNSGYFNQLRMDSTPWGGTLYTNSCWLSLTEIKV